MVSWLLSRGERLRDEALKKDHNKGLYSLEEHLVCICLLVCKAEIRILAAFAACGVSASGKVGECRREDG